MDKKQTYLKLNNGNSIPQIGFGVFQIKGDSETEKACLEAFKLGYRHIDTAHYYNNEKGVGSAIKKSNLKREEIFITSKLWQNELAEGKTTKAIDRMLKRLDTPYIDLLLIHWPFGDYIAAWKEMEKAVKDGKIKSIGLSNFYPDKLEEILKICTIKPVVDQVECHPYFPNNELRNELKKINAYIEAWSPIGRGDKKLLSENVLVDIGKKYNKSVVQVLIRWSIQKGNVVLPRSVNPIHIKENFDVFDFEISNEEMEKIENLKNDNKAIFCADFDAKLKKCAEMKVSEDD